MCVCGGGGGGGGGGVAMRFQNLTVIQNIRGRDRSVEGQKEEYGIHKHT